MKIKNKRRRTGFNRADRDHLLRIHGAGMDSNRDRAREKFEEGMLQLSENNFREAEKLFGQALYFDSSVSLYHFYQGLAMMEQHFFKDAQRALERAHALEPGNADYLAELGFVWLELGLPERALLFFMEALRARPDHARGGEGVRRLGISII